VRRKGSFEIVVSPTQIFRVVFNKISAMEPFTYFFRVLYLKFVELDFLRKTCTARLCVKNAVLVLRTVVLSRHYIAIFSFHILAVMRCRQLFSVTRFEVLRRDDM